MSRRPRYCKDKLCSSILNPIGRSTIGNISDDIYDKNHSDKSAEEIDMKFEDQYLDVLQNIEFGIVSSYRKHQDMTDYEVMRMLEALIDGYKAEKIGRPPRDFSLSSMEKEMYQTIRETCEWRLGRVNPFTDDQVEEEPAFQSRTVDEIILCLKRILKSVNTWNEEGGRKGYLNFIRQFVK